MKKAKIKKSAKPTEPFKFIRVSGRMKQTLILEPEGKSLTRMDLDFRARLDFFFSLSPGIVDSKRSELRYNPRTGVIVSNFQFVYADQDVDGTPLLFTLSEEERELYLANQLREWKPPFEMPRPFVIENIEITRIEPNPRLTKDQKESIDNFMALQQQRDGRF